MSINPYETSQPDISPQGLDGAGSEVSFRVTRGVLRHSIDHLLLHRHPFRLSIGSLLMIFASGAAIIYSAPHGGLFFSVALIASLGLTTAIYTALVRRSKKQMRNNLRETGLIEHSGCSVRIEDDQLVVSTTSGAHTWPLSQVKTYRTPFGLLTCPDPMTPIYIPRNNNSPPEAYASLRDKLKQNGRASHSTQEK